MKRSATAFTGDINAQAAKAFKGARNAAFENMAMGGGIGVEQGLKKPSQWLQRMPGMRNSFRSKIMQIGKPLYSFARKGVDFVNKIDDTLENIQGQNIPGISDAIALARISPLGRAIDYGANIADKALDAAPTILNQLDNRTRQYANAAGQAGSVLNSMGV